MNMAKKICNILAEFEKRYSTGMTHEEIMDVYFDIADAFELDPDAVADYVYLNRYADDEAVEAVEVGV
jgi:hypothetical protein